MPEGVLILLLLQDWLVLSWAECLFPPHSAVAQPGSLLKGILAFSSCLGIGFQQQQKLSWQIKGPQNYSMHGICIYCVILPASDMGGVGEEEKMEDILLHSCIFTLTSLIGEQGGQSTLKPSICTFQYQHAAMLVITLTKVVIWLLLR